MPSGTVVSFLITNAVLSYYLDSTPFNIQKHQIYNFIVIGGGTAGALVAAKLSDNPNFKVLLLEKGGSTDNFYSEIPYVINVVQDAVYKTPLLKEINSVKQRRACGSSNGICVLSLGNGLGGGSAHNGALYSRGSPIDYDQWQSRYGAKGWSYQDVLPYFKAIESYQNRSSQIDSRLHGYKPGNLQVSTLIGYPRLQRTLIEALSRAGVRIGDYNGVFPASFSISQSAVGHGRRSTSWNTFLEPVINRDNLDIISFASVEKINFDNNKKAISVSYTKDNTTFIARVSNEVILSAGAINSPKLLMLSGIGDARELSKLGISPIVSNLPPVGAFLQDHPRMLINLTLGETLTEPTFADYEEYKLYRSGFLARITNLVAGFSNDITSVSNLDTRYEHEFYVGDENDRITILTYLIAPKSRGSVKLASKDPNADPFVDPNYYGIQEDFIATKRLFKNFVKLIENSSVLKSRNITIRNQMIPGCGLFDGSRSLMNDNFFDCLIKMGTQTVWHYTSSCRMGSKFDPSSVVDPKCKLLGGVMNLRVIDASIMPQVTRGNTNAPTTMIAAKCVDMLIRDYQ